jgi:hypothetical protein
MKSDLPTLVVDYLLTPRFLDVLGLLKKFAVVVVDVV